MIGTETALWALLVLGGIASAVLVGLGASAYLDRRSVSYLAIVLALCALGGKAFVGGLSMLGVLSGGPHHVLEHGLDLLAVALLLLAIYSARRGTRAGRTSVPTGSREGEV